MHACDPSQASAGLAYSFSIYSPTLKARTGVDVLATEMIAAVLVAKA